VSFQVPPLVERGGYIAQRGVVRNAETLTQGLRNLFRPGSVAMGFMDQPGGRIQDVQPVPSTTDYHQVVIKRETRLQGRVSVFRIGPGLGSPQYIHSKRWVAASITKV
jgi:hypothetical protein